MSLQNVNLQPSFQTNLHDDPQRLESREIRHDERLEEEFRVLQEWGDYCAKKTKLHDQSRIFYMTLNNATTIPATLISAIASIAIIGISSNPTLECNHDGTTNWITLGFSSMNLLASASLTLAQFMKFGEYQKLNETVANDYEKLALEINMQLSLQYGGSYRNIAELMKNTKRHLDALIDKAPPVPKHIEKKMQELHISKIPDYPREFDHENTDESIKEIQEIRIDK